MTLDKLLLCQWDRAASDGVMRTNVEDTSKRPVDKQLLETSSTNVHAGEIQTSDGAQHVVLVNVAPLVRGHVLFVLDLNLVKPQKMTEMFLRYGLSISNTMQREDFALEHTGRLRIAVAELSGLVIAGDRIVYDQLTEETFSFVLQKEVSLSTDEETAIVVEWKDKLDITT
eukprot:jgi/Phyca11/17626/fgenesh1_pg.PHYCAscaffold_29_\